MGTGPFAVPSFDAIAQQGHDIPLVITRPQSVVKSRKGPPPAPVHDWATARGLPVESPASINDDAAVERLESLDAELMVVCDYGQILKPAALAATRWGGMNLHGSLLPAYRGAAPVQRALLAGDAETGVSVIHMTPRLDGGPVLAMRRTPIDDLETAGELEERLARLGVEATLEAIAQLADGHPEGMHQDPELITKAPRLSKAEARIDWSSSGRMIDCHVRGMQPWPVAFSEIHLREGKPAVRLAIRKVRWYKDASVGPEKCGQLLPTDDPDVMRVGCSDGYVDVLRVQPAGKKEMDAADFLRGHRPPPGTQLA